MTTEMADINGADADAYHQNSQEVDKMQVTLEPSAMLGASANNGI